MTEFRTPVTKNARQSRIAELIEREAIRSQTELATRLTGDGIAVSQPTLSMAEAKNWAAPGGVRSTVRLAEPSAESSNSPHRRESRASVAGAPGACSPARRA